MLDNNWYYYDTWKYDGAGTGMKMLKDAPNIILPDRAKFACDVKDVDSQKWFKIWYVITPYEPLGTLFDSIAFFDIVQYDVSQYANLVASYLDAEEFEDLEI